MITSTLQADPLLDHVSPVSLVESLPLLTGIQTSVSTREYLGRMTSNKLNGSNELPFAQSKFGHNIWQSTWQTSLEKNFDQGVRNNGISPRPEKRIVLTRCVGNKRPQPPSLALPNIKASAYFFEACADRRSPIGSERSTTRDSEPQSARSRSQHESSSLTPTSLSNDSDISIQPTTSSQNQRRQVAQTGSLFGSGSNQERASIWQNVPEFQPSFPVQHSNSLRSRSYEQQRNFLVGAGRPQPLGVPDYGFDGIWNLHEQDSFPFDRTAVGPILPTIKSTGTGDCYDRNERSVSSGMCDLGTSMSRFALDGEQKQNEYEHSGLQVQATSRPRFSHQNVQDHQYASRQLSGTWAERSCPPTQNKEFANLRSSTTCFDGSRPPTASRTDTLSANRSGPTVRDLQPSYPSNAFQNINSRFKHHFNEFRPAGRQSYTGQVYENGFYNVDIPPAAIADRGNFKCVFDSSLGDAYGLYDPAVRQHAEPSQLVRSPLLEEFRVHGKTKKYELRDIFGHIVEFSGDQLGSRFIQHKLEVANSEEKEQVFNEIACDSRQLMTDLFGNYVIQKLFEHGNQSQKKVLASHMKGHIIALSTQTYGCRVVQKALEHILTDQQASLIKELDGYVLKVVENQNGNHVIQKAIECVPGEHIQFIVDAHRGHVNALSKHAYGCRVIQRMLEHCTPRAKRAILDELHVNIGDLIQDPFGNYVVQHVIVNGEPHDRKPVIDKVQSRLLENSMHKFASNVVEKALDYAEEDQCQAMLRTLTSRDERGQSQILKLLNHQYGNYVIRKYR